MKVTRPYKQTHSSGAQLITRRFQFCAGHRVYGHESKCNNLHGHNYVAFVTVRGSLDSIGRVIDFSQVKALVGGWIDSNWDHAFICHADDEEALRAVRMVHRQAVYVMPSNPTAENMAAYLMSKATALLPIGLRCSRVELWETENCYAEVIA